MCIGRLCHISVALAYLVVHLKKKMAYEVKNKVFFVTGAASGIGAEVVKVLVEKDAKCVVVYDVMEKVGLALQNELNSKYENKVKFIKGDVTDEDHFVGTLKKIKDEIGLDALVNNAGIMNDSWEKYKKQIEINVTALITGTLHAIKLMRKDEGGNGGAVINISSVAGLSQASALPVYFATKSAVIQFSNCIGHDDYYTRTGVRVLAICFGRTDTPLIHNLRNFDEFVEKQMNEFLNLYPTQKPESAARGLVEAYKKGSSATTWLVTGDKPAQDISGNVQKAYDILSQGVY